MNEDIDFPAAAAWIGSSHAFDLHEAYLCFRSPRGWRLEQPPARAELFITADSRYRLWVNGRFVARGPARCYPHAQVVDRLDLSPYLVAGANTLAVQVYQPGYSHFAYVHRANAGLLAHLVCDGETALVTDSAWRTQCDPSYNPLVSRISIYQSGVEDQDLRRVEDWWAPDFDDSGWASSRITAAIGIAPWTGLEPRKLPLLVERELQLELVTGRMGVLPVTLHDPHLALCEGWRTAQAHTFACDADGWWAPEMADGEAGYWVYDLGRGYTCQGWVEVEGARGDEQILISYSEKRRGDEPYLSDPATYCRVRMTDRYGLRPGDQKVEPFAMRGGRILVFAVIGPTGPDLRLRFHARSAEYPLTPVRRLESDDPLLASVIMLCENTLRACLHDGWIDNPWRENAQWIGDPHVASLALSVLSEDQRPLRRVIEMASQGAYPDGILPGVMPSEAHAYTVIDFNFQWVELLHTYRRLTGDEGFVAAMWPTLVRMLERFSQAIGADGLIRSQPGRRLFLDWSPMSKREPNAAFNLHFLLALQLAAQLAAETGHAEEAGRWDALAADLQRAARKAFWQERPGRWWDDADAHASGGPTFSQLSTALALLTASNRPDEVPALLDALIARSLDPADESPVPGAKTIDPNRMVLASPYMHHRVFEALRRYGREQAVVDIIRLRWGRWVQAGYPTGWENWNVDFPDGSECHGFSAHPLYHLAEIAHSQSDEAKDAAGTERFLSPRVQASLRLRQLVSAQSG